MVDGSRDMEIKLYENCSYIVLPENTGANKYNGHRVYASMPLISNADYIVFLDEDNWFDADHIEKMYQFITENNLPWCYSLRKIVNQDGEYLFDDNCESLGDWPPATGNQKLIDTSCYMFKRQTLIRSAHHFYGNDVSQDRLFFEGLRKDYPDYLCNGEYSVNYRARDQLVPHMENANKVTERHFNGEYPWRKYAKV